MKKYFWNNSTYHPRRWSGFAWYKVSYGGGTYYVQITKDGKEKEVSDNSGKNLKNMIMI